MVSYNFLRLFGLKRSNLEQNMKQAELSFINFSDHCDPYAITDFPVTGDILSIGARFFSHLSKA